MKIAIGCDHAGFALKEEIKSFLTQKKVDIIDQGTDSPDSVDYPDFVHPVAIALNDGLVDLGILICGTGNGVAITANKYVNVRCALCWNPELARLSRQHNNANSLALPARFIDTLMAKKIVDAFLSSVFEGGRHERRTKKIIPEMGMYC